MSSGDFLWLSAARPQFIGDLQTWIRNDSLAPDWSRIGTDITNQGPFDASFSLSGTTVPEPSTLGLIGGGLSTLAFLRKRFYGITAPSGGRLWVSRPSTADAFEGGRAIMKKSIPYKTTIVRNHDLVHDSDIHKAWAMNLILAALVDPSFLGSTGNRPRLTNDDIATLVGRSCSRRHDRSHHRVIRRRIRRFHSKRIGTAPERCRRKGDRGNVLEGTRSDFLAVTWRDLDSDLLRTDRLPIGDTMTEFTITHRGTVYPWQCDHMGHMNVMWYAGKFDEACWQILATLGLTPARLRKEGAAMAAVEQHTHYKRELHAGDVISVRSAVLQIGEKSIHFIHEMRNDETEEIAATSTIVGVCINAASRKAQALPLDVRECASRMVNDQEDESSVYSGRNSGDGEYEQELTVPLSDRMLGQKRNITNVWNCRFLLALPSDVGSSAATGYSESRSSRP